MDKEHKLTDKKLAAMEKRLAKIYKTASQEVGQTWKKYMADGNKEIEELQKIYDKAKLGGDRDEIRKAGMKLSAAKREFTLTNTHYKNLVAQYAEEMKHVNEIALAYVNGNLPEVYALNYNRMSELIEGASIGVSFELTDANTIKDLATTNKTLLPYKEVDGRKDVRWNTKRLNAQVMQGILQGESMDKIAVRLDKVTNGNMRSAIINARTMVTSAECKGRQDSYKRAEDMGIVVRIKWMSAHDNRVRDAHKLLDGQIVKVGQPFDSELGKIRYPADPAADPANVYGCRCTTTAIIDGFKKVK